MVPLNGSFKGFLFGVPLSSGIHIAYNLVSMQFLFRYFRAQAYTTWAHGPFEKIEKRVP